MPTTFRAQESIVAKKKTTKGASGGKTASPKSKPKPVPKPKSKPAATATKSKTTAAKGAVKGKTKAKAEVETPRPKSTGLNLAQGTGLKIKAKIPLVPPSPDAAPKPVFKPVVKPSNDEEQDERILTDDDLRKVKTGLAKKDMEHYWSLLLQKRGEILGDVESLQTDAKNDGGNLSNMPLHMADVGSDNYEQEFTLGLVESERKLLNEINEALLRIKAGTYGVCLVKGVPINRARLDVTPWAKYCIEAARELERRSPRR